LFTHSSDRLGRFSFKESHMKMHMNCSILLTSLVLASPVLSACQTDKHTMVEPPPGSRVVCRECYDEVYKVTYPTGSRWGTTYQETRTRHQCSSCKTEMSIYSENGVLKVKCARCAPEGLACDKCLPPKDYTPPKLGDEPSTK
jgi:hypothetical protein